MAHARVPAHVGVALVSYGNLALLSYKYKSLLLVIMLQLSMV